MIRVLIIYILLPVSVFADAREMTFIKPNDKALSIEGAFFLKKSSKKVVIDRINPSVFKNKETFMNPVKARTQTGVRISVYTDSDTVSFLFSKREQSEHRHSVFGVFKNDKLFKTFDVKPGDDKTVFTVISDKKDEWNKWTIVLPPYYGVDFKGVDIFNKSRYKPVPKTRKPVYVAIGNSITHGTGQKAGCETYPYILASKKNWSLYNVAVGGSKISWPVAGMLKNKKVDVITVLWGYNDWNAGFTPDEQIFSRYSELLELLVKHHPEAKIYCILPTATKSVKPKKGNFSLDDVKNAEKKAAESLIFKGYTNIKIIDGGKISDTTMLKDKVHFSAAGAKKFAGKLSKIIK